MERRAHDPPHDRVRVSFAVPWEGMLLLGTTDDLYEGEPDDVAATPEDVDQILAEAAVALDPDVLRPDAVRSVYAGLRVLPARRGRRRAHGARPVYLRPHGHAHGRGREADDLPADRARCARPGARRPRPAPPPRQPVPLPGAEGLSEAGVHLARAHPGLEPAIRSHLAHLYPEPRRRGAGGSSRDPPSAGLNAEVDGPDIAAQAVYAQRREWACKPEDILQAPDDPRAARPAADRKLAEVLRSGSSTITVFVSVNVSKGWRPPHRPMPLREPARPPNGRWLSQ